MKHKLFKVDEESEDLKLILYFTLHSSARTNRYVHYVCNYDDVINFVYWGQGVTAYDTILSESQRYFR
jgi:hypothetical protein